AHEVNVGLDAETRRGKDAFANDSLHAREAGSFDKLEPFFDAARDFSGAILIENPFAPSDAERVVLAASEDRCVLNGNMALIVVAIQSPSLELATRKLAIVHQLMKRVLVVIALLTDGVKAGDEIAFGEYGLFGAFERAGHNSISIPS